MSRRFTFICGLILIYFTALLADVDGYEVDPGGSAIQEDTVPEMNHWPVHIIDNSSSGADGVKLSDINGDDLPDIVTGWEEGGITRVYLHPGATGVRNQWPAIEAGSTPDVEDAMFMDIDSDGLDDVVTCTEGSTRTIFFHFCRKENGQYGWPIQKTLPASDHKMQWMYAEALQIDGKHGNDLIAAGKNEGAAIGWFSSPKDPLDLDQWRWYKISDVGWIMSIILEDMDGDGDKDIVVTDRKGDQRACRWLENPGMGDDQKGPWTSHLIGASTLEVMFMDMVDLDQDGIKEAIVAERTTETIKIFSRKSYDDTWQSRSIPLTTQTGRAKSVSAGDIDGDAIPDLVISTNTEGSLKHGLSWISGTELNKQRPFFNFIAAQYNAKYDKVELLDLDLDGDLDVLICEENFGKESRGLGVVWYENKLPK